MIDFLLLLTIVTNLASLGSAKAFEPERGCSLRTCQESALNECALRGHAWASLTVNGVHTCVCCEDEREALQVAGTVSSDKVGQFFGNVLRVCEALHIEEGHCRSRESRDCNFIPAFKNSAYIGCFYCRPRCDYESHCQDLGRTCDLSKDNQPVRACTGTGSGYIPGFDDPREYETAIKKNYLVIIREGKNETAINRRPLLTTPSTTSVTSLPNICRKGSGVNCQTQAPIEQQEQEQEQQEETDSVPEESQVLKKNQIKLEIQKQIDEILKNQDKHPQQQIVMVTAAPVTTSSTTPENRFVWPFNPNSIFKQWNKNNNKIGSASTTTTTESSIKVGQIEQHKIITQERFTTVQPTGGNRHIHGDHDEKDCPTTGTPVSSEMIDHADIGFDQERTPHGSSIHRVIAPSSHQDPDRFHRGFKPADSNETLYVIKNNHRKINMVNRLPLRNH